MIRLNYKSTDPLQFALLLKDSADEIYIIESFPSDDRILENFIWEIGRPIEENRNPHSDITFEVSVTKKDKLFTSYATSNYHFPLHTDCSDLIAVPNALAMLCVTPATNGGDSILVYIDDVISQFSAEEVAFLLEKKWLFRKIWRPILSKTNTGYSVCYNRITMESYAKLTSSELAFLNKFDEVLNLKAINFKLKSNELLIIRNDKFLHGRTEFSENSDRLLRRIRFNV
ncbi:hypothetical protein GCM10007940_44610 [Portibacter lacus]|uniref:TauD/TfdA-like domain-containing protein n=1 Tax=Portibacter lacus TaxID=1099794 RepID=A0AA37WIK9_9BACT|nr:hypothetical protein GCM10007940_44610 [Portibacter lacus]